MAALAGGTFKMGDRGDTVTVASFCLDTTEVTVAAYGACVLGGRCSAEHLNEFSREGENFTASPTCNYGVLGKGDHPINCVDWNQSTAYCREQGKRLPTESEWEWAARGGSRGRIYPWGDDKPGARACWSGVTKLGGTCAVGSSPDGDAAGGIHDLAGNVWEWTATYLDAKHVARAVRGGGWESEVASYLRAADRSSNAPGIRGHALGFRCAQSN